MGITSIIVLSILVLAIILLVTGIRTKNTRRIIWAILLLMLIVGIYFLLSYLISLM